MKVAILTITNGENYGNRLQNYSVQKVIKSLDLEVETIPNITNQNYINNNSIKQKIKRFLVYNYMNLKGLNSYKFNNMLRYVKFKNFTNKYINQSEFYISDKSIPNDINKKYDFFICGSDQIWNPEFYFNSEIDFLTFAKKGKRIAYSPSFGISELPKDCKKNYKEWLSGMDYLSVREEAGARIIKELTGKEAQVLLDPTLMLSKNEWLMISNKPKIKKIFKNKFILTYFLGDRNSDIDNRINDIAKENNLEIINLLDINDKYIYSVDPSEFIWLIDNCSLMCTDSFHGTVFSLIMKKPFIVFERIGKETSMNSRLETLLNLFKMKNRISKNIKNTEVFNINFDHVDNIINEERKKTLKYLKKALNINE